MWTVMVVEDEQFAREMIKETMDWEEMGLTFIGEAGNGIEALHFIQQHRPDIVICDIIMPYMNGIELLQNVRQEGIESKFIMLTCANEFDYVRRALELGASNYILKLSMSVKSLKESLQKVKKELAQKTAYSKADIEEYYERLWNSLHEAAEDVSNLTYPPLSNADSYQLVILGFYSHSGISTLEAYKQYQLPPKNDRTVLHVFTKMGFTSVFLWYECGYVIDMGDFSENRDLIYSPINDYRKLPEMWSQVLQSAEELWYQEVPLAQRSDDSSIRNPRSSINLWEYERKLIREFENLKAGSCKQQIESLWTKMNQERVPMDKVKHTIISIDQILSKISQFPQTHKDAIEYCSSHEQLRLLFSDLVEQYMSFWMNNRYCVLSDHPQINQTIAYIQHHYQLNLTVRSLAKLVSMDETYLSNLFKKKAGTTIIKYIHRLRIDRSILLLEQFDHPIHEIAESVGFDDHNYFNRVFKRYTGMSPGDYRKQHNQRLLS